jgi:hypothetical protein
MSIGINPNATKMADTLAALRNGQKNAAEGLKLSENAPSDPHGIRAQTFDGFAPLQTHAQLQVGLTYEEARQSQIVMFGGREFALSDHVNKDSLNLSDPNISVSSTGYLMRKTMNANGTGTIELLGRDINAPEWVNPAPIRSDFTKLSTDFFTGSENFARATLDFFSRGTATQADFDRTKASIDNVLKEISEMLKSGGEVDYNNVQSKIDIMGEQVSLSQLLEMQKKATELTDKLYEKMGIGNSTMTDFALRGMIKAIGVEYGNQVGGKIGEMFSAAFAAEADNNAQGLINLFSSDNSDDKSTAFARSAVQNGAKWLYDVFAKVDMSSKENAQKSFNALSGEIDGAIEKYMNQYTGGGSATWSAQLRNEVNGFFNNALSLIN